MHRALKPIVASPQSSLAAVSISVLAGWLLSDFILTGDRAVAPILLGAVLLTLMVAGLLTLTRRARIEGSDGLEQTAVIFLGIALVSITWNGIRLAPNAAFSDIFLVLSAIVYCIHLLLTNTWPRNVPAWLYGPALATTLSVFITTIWANLEFGMAAPGYRYVITLALTPLVIGFISSRPNVLSALVNCWLLSVVINASVGVLDHFFGTQLADQIVTDQAVSTTRSAGLSTHSNHLAFMAAMALPVITARIASRQRIRSRSWYVIAAVLTAAAILASGSRGALVGTTIVLLAFPFLTRQRRIYSVGALVLLALIALTMAISTWTSMNFVAIDRVLGDPSVQASDSQRAQFQADAIAQIWSSPVIGNGYEAVRDAHSLYLQLLVAGGLIALVSFVVFASGALGSAFRHSRSRNLTHELRYLAAGFYGSILSWLVVGAVENQIYDRYLYVPAGFLVAIGIHERKRLHTFRQRSFSSSIHDITTSNVATLPATGLPAAGSVPIQPDDGRGGD